ncbi:MAG: hypothetical protein Roseis2KO_31990 [Roseivirga sp.]
MMRDSGEKMQKKQSTGNQHDYRLGWSIDLMVSADAEASTELIRLIAVVFGAGIYPYMEPIDTKTGSAEPSVFRTD